MRISQADQPFDITIDHLFVAGWTGRDGAAVRHHIDELADLGVAPPSQVPLYYRVSHALLTQAPVIEVLGESSSGEVEPLLIRQGGKTWLGLASDHTDRDLEAHSVAASKQACAKPMASGVWDVDELRDRLDSLVLRCEIRENGDWVTYQDGTLASIRPLQDLMTGAGLGDNAAMLCGTLGAIGGVRPASEYRMRMEDPATGRQIALEYAVRTLPIVA
ncbi:DUF2848 domain-containing protein [Pukyongiella litopenaei]|uniref:DUF2848 domain-containing protein n=1 Tax=Pukyongiella litopenaei TaxID=2605946 RepID=A0A2S0MMQ2_9RHOB|nr:DUF2848 domain-containing protein [Pukyongiella litopenaei]AVO37156.1 DUF2848 domain-containing protein [Pukyongiella litopenaei]